VSEAPVATPLSHDRDEWRDLIDLEALARWMDAKRIDAGDPIEHAEAASITACARSARRSAR
jgi:hypothetical protein